MPLTEKGKSILASMEKTYGAEKGKQVLYASKNAGKITGIDSEKCDALTKIADACMKYDSAPKDYNTSTENRPYKTLKKGG